MILRIFAFASWSLLRPILDRFWFDFGPPNRSKIGPKRVPKGVGNHGRFWTPSRTSKNQVFDQHDPNFTPTWPPNGQVFWGLGTSFLEPGAPFFHPGPPTTAWPPFCSDFGSILDRFWTVFGSILHDFSTTFRTSFHVFAVVFWPKACKITSYFASLLLANLALTPSPQFWLLSFSEVATQPRLQNFRPHARPGGMREALRITEFGVVT